MHSARPTWIRALAEPSVRRRAIVVGAAVGAAQVVVNQGDAWLGLVARREMVGASIVVKTLLSPLITVSVAWISAACAWADREREREGVERT
jgi:hypothetical protein